MTKLRDLIFIFILIIFNIDLTESKCPIKILPEFCSRSLKNSRCLSYFSNVPSNFSFGKNYASNPREIKIETSLTEDDSKIVNFTWKPPNDSSISFLKGYEVSLPSLFVSSYSFIFDFSHANFTQNDSQILFSFSCKVKRDARLIFCLNSLPIPTNNSFFCRDEGSKAKTDDEISTIDFPFTPVPSVAVKVKDSGLSPIWFVLLGMGVFVLTIALFAAFILKETFPKFQKNNSETVEEALARINADNDSEDLELSEDEDGEV